MQIYETAARIVFRDAVTVPKGTTPILYSSCKLDAVLKHQSTAKMAAIIRDTDSGKQLAAMDLMKNMPQEMAYLFWFYLSCRYIAENKWPESVLLFADVANRTSTVFCLELPLMQRMHPHVEDIFNPLTGFRLPRSYWQGWEHIESRVERYIRNAESGFTDPDCPLTRKFGAKAAENDQIAQLAHKLRAGIATSLRLGCTPTKLVA